MRITQITPGRFHHFHLAKQLEKHDRLDTIWTAYPKFKLRNENGIPPRKLKSFPWIHAPYMKRDLIGLDRVYWLNRQWEWMDRNLLDKYVASTIKTATTVVALSGSGLHAGKKAKASGGFYVCDRGSTHIRFQDTILKEEYKKWKIPYNGIDGRIVEKEEAEYALADRITVPSSFVEKSFHQYGIRSSKLARISYGVNLERFRKSADPCPGKFRLLWVGNVSIRKGFMYAFDAFMNFQHPAKEFFVIGSVSHEVKKLIAGHDLSDVHFAGHVSNHLLPGYYSSANAFVLPSIEEGLAMVQGEALSCGCPVIATPNTGAEDLFTDGKHGFIISAGSSSAVLEKLQQLADDPLLREKMSEAAIERVTQLKGWDSYGNAFVSMLNELHKQ